MAAGTARHAISTNNIRPARACAATERWLEVERLDGVPFVNPGVAVVGGPTLVSVQAVPVAGPGAMLVRPCPSCQTENDYDATFCKARVLDGVMVGVIDEDHYRLVGARSRPHTSPHLIVGFFLSF